MQKVPTANKEGRPIGMHALDVSYQQLEETCRTPRGPQKKDGAARPSTLLFRKIGPRRGDIGLANAVH
jgi:hypothetical protein